MKKREEMKKDEERRLEESKKKLAEAKRKLKEKRKRESEATSNRVENKRKQDKTRHFLIPSSLSSAPSIEAGHLDKLKAKQKKITLGTHRAKGILENYTPTEKIKNDEGREQIDKTTKYEEKEDQPVLPKKKIIKSMSMFEKIKEKIAEETIQIKKEKEKSQKLVKFYENNILKFKEELKDLDRKEKEKITQKKKLAKKIENKERLYDPSIIKSISDEVSLRIFYNPEKKENAYFHFTDFINRIEIREEEMKKEIKITQNIVNLSIRYTSGDEYRIETLNAGGVMDHHPFDAPAYNLRISITVEEQYLIKKIMSLIRSSFPKMSAMDGKLGISAFLEDQNYDEEYSRRIIQQITRRTCEEFEKLGEVLIEKY